MIRDADLDALEEKYARMRALRQVQLAAQADPTCAEPDTRPERIALAARFPGVLRELDELPLAAIEMRLAAVAAVRGAGAPVPRWMTAQIAFHRLLRGALFAKRWMSERRARGGAGARPAPSEFRRDAIEEAWVWAEELDAIDRPPGGRIMPLVYQRLAAELGVDEREARRRLQGEGDDEAGWTG